MKSTSSYEFFDGEPLSYSGFKSLMYEYPESKKYMRRSNFWRGMVVAGGVAFIGTFLTAISTDSENVSSVCMLSSILALGSTSLFGYSTIYHKAKAEDYYNMHILDEELNYLKKTTEK